MINNGLISATQLSRSEIEDYIDLANQMIRDPSSWKISKNSIAALLFFEESTRTRVGFTSAAYRLGAQVVLVNETKLNIQTSMSESLEDTIRSIQSYCDVICMRHPDKDVFDRLEPILEKPIINCGNANAEHPTQSLIDLMTIKNELSRLDNLSIAIVGNPRFSRAAHSLLLALLKFKDIKIRTIAPRELHFTEDYKRPFINSGNTVDENVEMDISGVDVVYVTGFPHKLPIGEFSQETQNKYSITPGVASRLKDDAIILCPLPRIDEIDAGVDDEPSARYFKQSENGLYMRMAILKNFLQ